MIMAGIVMRLSLLSLGSGLALWGMSMKLGVLLSTRLCGLGIASSGRRLSMTVDSSQYYY